MKVWKYLEYGLLIISLVLFVVYFLSPAKDGVMLDGYLGWAYILLIAGLVLAILFPLADSFKSAAGIKKLLLLIVGVVVVFGGIYMLAPGNPIEVNTAVENSTFKFTDAALYVTYLFILAALGAIIWSIIHNAIKNR